MVLFVTALDDPIATAIAFHISATGLANAQSYNQSFVVSWCYIPFLC